MRPSYRLLLALALLAAAVSPALAVVQEWYDYYDRARDHDIPARRWADCVRNLDRALERRPASGINVRTYGMWYEQEYLPHYYRGVCLLRQENYDAAIEEFNREEKAGAVKGAAAAYAELTRLRGEAHNGQAARTARAAREQFDRLLEQARDLGRRAAYDEALAKLNDAEAIAKGLGSNDALRTVNKEQERLRTAQRQAAEAAARSQRLEQRVAEGRRLLEDGRATDALLAFNEALDVDPNDARAVEGRRVAEERILGTTTRENRKKSAAAGKALFEAGQYEQALAPLTDAAADPENAEARELLKRARNVLDQLRNEKELRAEVQELMARGEKLMAAGRFNEAQVAFDRVLRLDPGFGRARARLEQAEQRTGEAILQRWLPNQEPTLTLFAEQSVSAPRVLLQGSANDDRGISKLEFRVGGMLVLELAPTSSPGDPQRRVRISRELPLAPGRNAIAVTAIDSGGLSHSESLTVDRHLRFHETPYFLPSALAGAVSLVGLGWGAQRVRRRRAMRRRFNPYIAGAPVLDDGMFYGRGKLTERMLGTLHRNSLMITGERRIGKTTFLHHLKRVLEEDTTGEWRFFPVFVDLQGVPEQAFFHAVMADVIDGVGLSGQTREKLRHRAKLQGYEARDFSHDLPLVLAELRTRTDRKVKLALLIDEVDVLNEYSEAVNQRLRGIFMKSFSENLVAVMSGVSIRRRWHSEVSPWYNFFDEIELPPFTREEAEALIREPVERVFRFQPEAVERIVELSRLRPYLVQKYCIHAVARMLDEGRSTVRIEDVEAARAAVEAERPGSTPEPRPAAPTVAD